MDIKPHLKSLISISNRVLSQFHLHNFKITRTVFERIIISFSHVDQLSLTNCDLYSYQCKFKSNLDYCIEILDFTDTGGGYASDWYGCEYKYDSILRAIKSCGLKGNYTIIKSKFYNIL